jgi:DHA1 family bicyclomycin/chloramphenicol resistance-like MFS transporter
MTTGSALPRDLSRAEFIGLAAAIMAVDALAIDIMLPALPNIGDAFSLAKANDRSLVLTAFMVGFGFPQLFFGPLTDRFGRRWPTIIGLAAYVVTSLLAPLSPSFIALLGLRFLQGVAAAAVRVALFAAVRDRFSGKAMSDVMALMLAIFLLVPIFMPGVGQVILLLGPWQLIFVAMGSVAAAILVWTMIRLPESLAQERRRSLDLHEVRAAFAMVLTNRMALSYGLSGPFLLGLILALVNTAQQVYVEIYGLGVYFPLAFALMAGGSAAVALLGPKVINRVGVRRTAHGAMTIFTAAAGLWFILSLAGFMPLWLYLIMIGGVVPLVAFAFPTTAALSMEPLGEVAGTASAVFGSAQVIGGAFLGYLVAQAFDGTVVPVIGGTFLFGLCTLGCFLVAENGRLFRAQGRSPSDEPSAHF